MKKKMTMTSGSGSRASKREEDAYKTYATKAKEQEKEQPQPRTKKAVKLCPKCKVPLTTSDKPDMMRCNTCTWLYDKDQWIVGTPED